MTLFTQLEELFFGNKNLSGQESGVKNTKNKERSNIDKIRVFLESSLSNKDNKSFNASIDQFVSNGIDLSGPCDQKGNSAFHYLLSLFSKTSYPVKTVISEKDCCERLKYLFEKGGEPLKSKESLHKALFIMANEKPLLDLVEFLIEKGADVNVKNRLGNTLLNSITTQIISLTEKHGAPVGAASAKGKVVLEYLYLLLASKANPNLTDNHSTTPLHIVSRAIGKINIPNIYSDPDFPTLLSAVSLLLHFGADLTLQDKDEKTSLEYLKNFEGFKMEKTLWKQHENKAEIKAIGDYLKNVSSDEVTKDCKLQFDASEVIRRYGWDNSSNITTRSSHLG